MLATEHDVGARIDTGEMEVQYFLEKLSFTFTNRCDLRCVYCPQGTHPESFHAEAPEDQIELIVNYVRTHGTPCVNIGYYGETTLVKGWEKVCERLLDAGVRLTCVMNFAQILSSAELAVLARFSEVGISIDAVDPALLRRVRKSVDSRTILFNTLALRGEVLRRGVVGPKLIWTGVLSDWVVKDAANLVAMAAAAGVLEIHFNDLAYFDGARDKALNIIDLPDDGFEEAVDALEEARKLAARLGVRFSVAGDSAIEQRLVAMHGYDALITKLGRLPSLEMLRREDLYYVYGAGVAGRSLVTALRERGFKVAGLIDTFARGRSDGLEILSLDAYVQQVQPEDFILICSAYEDEIDASLERAGLKRRLKTHGLYRSGFLARAPVVGETVKRTGIQGQFTLAGDAGATLEPGMTRLCLSPWAEVLLEPKGEVYSCCQRGGVMGRVGAGESLEAVLEGDAYRELRRGLLSGVDLDPACAACPAAAACTPQSLQTAVRAHLAQSGRD